MVNETNEAYAYLGDDPVDGSDPLGLCNSGVANGYYPGPCATTAAESMAAAEYVQSHVSDGGWNLTQALHSEADYLAGVGNGVVSSVTFGQVHVPQPYCNALNWAYGVGMGFGVAVKVVGPGAAVGPSTTIGDAAFASDTLGADSTLFASKGLGSEDGMGLLNQRGGAAAPLRLQLMVKEVSAST